MFLYLLQELELEKQARKKQEKDLKKANDVLEEERNRQKQIVLLLLAERKKLIMKYVEERKRSEDLAQVKTQLENSILLFFSLCSLVMLNGSQCLFFRL